jgi:hypothetical protein
MKSRYTSVAAAIALLGVFVLVPAPAHAQRTETGVGGTTYAPPVRSYVRPVPASGVRVNINRTGGTRSIGTSGRGRRRADASAFDNGGFGFSGAGTNLEQLLNITPNSGFNWEHVNAINQDLPLKALVDPVTQLEIAQAERLLRTTGGGVSGAYISWVEAIRITSRLASSRRPAKKPRLRRRPYRTRSRRSSSCSKLQHSKPLPSRPKRFRPKSKSPIAESSRSFCGVASRSKRWRSLI